MKRNSSSRTQPRSRHRPRRRFYPGSWSGPTLRQGQPGSQVPSPMRLSASSHAPLVVVKGGLTDNRPVGLLSSIQFSRLILAALAVGHVLLNEVAGSLGRITFSARARRLHTNAVALVEGCHQFGRHDFLASIDTEHHGI